MVATARKNVNQETQRVLEKSPVEWQSNKTMIRCVLGLMVRHEKNVVTRPNENFSVPNPM
jgi:hypothetical protein